MEFIRHLGYKNKFNTNYRVYCIQFEIPIIGNKINNWLYDHRLSNNKYIKSCNTISYVRKWYRKEVGGWYNKCTN